MKKNIILINDTSQINHFGCRFVNYSLNQLLKKNNLNPVLRCLNEEKHENIIQKTKNLRFDGIVINGEGTLHDKQNYSETIFNLIEYFYKNYGKNIFLINAVIQNLPKKSLDSLRKCKKIYVRESCSQKYLLSKHIKSKVVPDLIFGYTFPKEKKIRSNKIVFTDSVFVNTTKNLFKISKLKTNYVFCPLMTKPKIQNYKSIHKLLKFYLAKIKSNLYLFFFNKESNFTRYYIEGSNNFLKLLRNSSLTICGRFHGLVFSMILNTPFLAIESNTYKTIGLLNDVKMKNRLIKLKSLKNKNFEIYKNFSKLELSKILKYKKKANKKILKMFNEIKNCL